MMTETSSESPTTSKLQLALWSEWLRRSMKEQLALNPRFVQNNHDAVQSAIVAED